jgi:integrase
MAKKTKPMKGVSSITRNGVRYWYARIDGRKNYCGKGDKGLELANAAKAKEEVKKYEHKEVSAGLRVKRYDLKTFKHLSNWYMTLPTIQNQAIYKRKVSISNHLMKYFGSRAVNQIEADDIERYREHRLGEGSVNGTIDLEVQVLRSMFNLAITRKKIPPDSKPGEFVQLREANPRRTVTDDEFQRILKHAEDDFKEFLICGYETGMRSSEICNLTADRVKLDIQHISGATLDYIDLGIFDTKTKARRTVPISPTLKDILKRRLDGLDPDDLVFTRKGRKFLTGHIGERLKAVCEKAKVVYGDKVFNDRGERIGIVFHSFRHTRTTKWVEAGFSDEIIRRATGHKSLDAYRNYVKLDPHVVMRLVESKTDKNGIKSLQTHVK